MSCHAMSQHSLPRRVGHDVDFLALHELVTAANQEDDADRVAAQPLERRLPLADGQAGVRGDASTGTGVRARV